MDHPRLDAYRIAMRITPEPWKVTEVIHRADRILRFIAGDERELRVAVLETLTTALGVGPDRPVARSVTNLPDAEQLIEQARRVLTYVKN